MKTTLNTRDFIHISEYSSYNHNYYRNTRTGQILFEHSDDDHGHDYWWTTETDMMNHSHRNDEWIGACWMEDFDIPTQYAREHGVADEYEFEFDSEWC